MGTITKALDLLNLFSRVRRELGLTEIVRLTGRDKATVHRHLLELHANGFLEQHPETRAYRLGPAILRLTAVREATHPTRRILRPVVAQLSEALGELVHASLLQGDMLSPVVHADPQRHGTQVFYDESERLPLHATASGLAVLAFLPAPVRERILSGPLPACTAHTETDPEALRVLCAQIRGDGIARMARGFDDEVASQAAPIFDAEAQVTGALAVAVPVLRASEDASTAARPALLAAARTATLSLGGTPPDVLSLQATA